MADGLVKGILATSLGLTFTRAHGVELVVLQPWIIFVVTWGGPLLGLAFGRWEERTLGAACIARILISSAAARYTFGSHTVLEMELDLFILSVALLVAVPSHRTWPLPYASLALLTVVTAAVQLVSPFPTWAYGVTQGAWETLANLLLLWVSLAASQRRLAGLDAGATSGAVRDLFGRSSAGVKARGRPAGESAAPRRLREAQAASRKSATPSL
jgi:hypothetical protein